MFKAIKEFFLGKPEPVAETVTAPYKIEPAITPPVQPVVELLAVAAPPLDSPSLPTATKVKTNPTKRPPKVAKPTPTATAKIPKVPAEKKSDSKKTAKAIPVIKKVAAAKIAPAVKNPRVTKMK